MKKFVKYGLIGGCVLCLTGVGLATASFALGADMERIVKYLELRGHIGGSVERHLDSSPISVDRNGIQIRTGDGEVGIGEDGIRIKAEDRQVQVGEDGVDFKTENSWVSPSSEGSFEAGYKTVTNLEIKVNGGSVNVFSLDEIEELTIKSGKGTLDHVKFEEFSHDQKLSLTAYDGEDYQIFIPSSWELEELEVNALKGDFTGENIRAYDAEYEAKGGGISVSQIGGNALELKVTDGSISWTAVEEMPLSVEADCRNGDLMVELPEGTDADGIGYEIECKNGVIEIPGFTAEGMMEKKIPGNPGMTQMELEAENGTITVAQ